MPFAQGAILLAHHEGYFKGTKSLSLGICYKTIRTVGLVGRSGDPGLLFSPAQPWTTQLWDLTGFSYSDLVPCVLSLHKKW